MKVNLRGLALNVANELERLAKVVREAAGYDPNDEEQDDPAGMVDLHVFCLRELAAHALAVTEDPGRLPEFADLYCLKATSKGSEG